MERDGPQEPLLIGLELVSTIITSNPCPYCLEEEVHVSRQ